MIITEKILRVGRNNSQTGVNILLLILCICFQSIFQYRISNLHFLRTSILRFLKFCPTELEVAGVIHEFHMY